MAQSNIFEAGAAEVPELFADYIESPTSESTCIALALSSNPLGDAERNAIEKSLLALGFGENACTYATLSPQAPNGGEGSAGLLDGQALFLLVEGLDPLRLIVADADALAVVERAYRAAFPHDAAARIFGRPSACFADLSALLETDAGKQRAWAVFKTLAL